MCRPLSLSRVLFLLVLCTLVLASRASADTIELVRPDGGRVVIPVLTGSAAVDVRQGNVHAQPIATQGVIGDGWCPGQDSGATSAPDPSLRLRLSNGMEHRIPLVGTEPMTWQASSGVLALRTRASSGVPGDGWCPPVTPPPRFTEPLSAQPATLEPGAETVLRWTAVEVTTCTTTTSTYPPAVASVPGWLPSMPITSGGTRLRLAEAGDYRFRLVCQRDAATVASETLVQVRAGTPGPTCTGVHAPPMGRTRQLQFVLDDLDLWRASNTDWHRYTRIDLAQWHPPPAGQVDAFGVNRGFPGLFGRSVGDTGTLEVETGQYVALRFDTTGQQGRAGQVSWEQPGAFGAPLLVTFSRCPGDFAPADARCRSNGSAASGLGWTTGVVAPGYCPLDGGTTWYLNIIFGSPANPGQNTCPHAQCRWLFTQACQAGCGAR